MTGFLDLKLIFGEVGETWRHGIAATLERLDPPIQLRDFLVPASRRPLTLELKAGTYRVQLVMPNGRILQRQARITEGKSREIEITIESDALPTVFEDYASMIDDAAAGSKDWMSPFELQPAYSTEDELDWPPGRLNALDWPIQSAEEWSYFASALTNEIHESLSAHGPAVLVRTGDAAASFQHRWVVAHTNKETQYACLPPEITDSYDVDVKLYVDNKHKTTRSLAVRTSDQQFGALLSYFEHGRLGLAQRMLDLFAHESNPEGQLRRDPLALCAAGYIQLALASHELDPSWSDLASRIAALAPDIPDASIVRARSIVQTPNSKQGPKEALELAKAAFRAGIPYFSVGVQHLRDLLEILGSNDDEAAEMAQKVRKVSIHLDYRQALTVMHVPRAEAKDVQTQYLSG